MENEVCNIMPCLHDNECSDNLVYYECGPCESTCSSVATCDECKPAGCYCPRGLVFDSFSNKTSCIPHAECGCHFQDKFYAPGSYVPISTCETCMCSYGHLTSCKIKEECDSTIPKCMWSSWGSWGPCFGPCGVNGIQWSFRSPAVPSVYGLAERCQGISKKSRRCRTTECSFCHDEEGMTRMVGAQWRQGCTVCRCMKSGNVQCNKFCEYQLLSNGCKDNMTLVEPDDGCCYCSDKAINESTENESTDTDVFIPPIIDKCPNFQFLCSNRQACVDYTSVCDGVVDCLDESDEQHCNECLLTQWTEWSKCSKSCGVGLKIKSRKISIRNRKIDQCEHDELENVEPCHLAACPINGKWSPWSQWGECDRVCDGGQQTRHRSCTGSKNGGKCPHGQSSVEI